MTQPRTPLILLALTAGISLQFTTLSNAQEVVDPSTGNTVDLTEIDFTTLTRSDARDIISQLQDQGLTRGEAREAVRDERRADIGALEVTDPTTGETTTLSEIDRESLSREDRQAIREQLANAGVQLGGGRRDGAGERGGEGPGGPGGRRD